MQTAVEQLLEQLRKTLPAVFAGVSFDELTGGAIRWETIQKKRCKREIPDECFARSTSARGVLVVRDPLLDWWATTLTDARQPFAGTPRRRRRNRSDAEVTAA